jgi:hypothetical protein
MSLLTPGRRSAHRDGEASEQFTPCDGATRPWSADVFGNGRFAGGKAATVAFAFGCDTFSCGEGYAEASVQLSRNGKQR